MFSQALTHSNLEASLESIPDSVIHWTKGRVRLRIPPLSKEPDYAAKLERSLKACPSVTQVTLNAAARCATIHYCANQTATAKLREHLAMALQHAAAPIPDPYTTKALAQRLGVPFQALNWRRSQVDFAEWSRSKDPQGIAWSYDAEAKCFYACTTTAIPEEPSPSRAERIFQALAGAASGRLGGVVGKLAGEVIGLALLGSAGVIVGAEIGTLIGEIVGGELGSV